MSLDLKELKRIIELMEKHDLAFLNLKNDDFKLKLKKNSPYSEIDFGHQPQNYSIPQINKSEEKSQSISKENIEKDLQNNISDKAKPQAKSNLFDMNSPMVGTYYSAPDPDSPPYVNVGDKVKKGSTVCIIEAMKVMNEIKIEKSGTIEEILLEDGSPVQFGETLFKIKP